MRKKPVCARIDPVSFLEDEGIGLVRLDQDGRITAADPTAARLMLKDGENISGRLIRDIIPEEAYGALTAALETSLQDQAPAEAELCIPPPGPAWLLFRCRPCDGGFVATIRDVTAVRKLELELRDSEERFQAIREASFGGIAVHEKGVILECNKGLSDITGFPRDELIGMDGLQLIAPAWRDLVMLRILEGYRQAYDVEGIRKDGTLYPLEIRGKNIPFRGRTVRVTEFRDITERKLAETALRIREEHYRTLYENLGQGVCEFDESGALVSANPAASMVLGVNLSEMTGIRSEDLMKILPVMTREDGGVYLEHENVIRLTLESGRAMPDQLVRFFNHRKNEHVWIMLYTVPQFRPGQEKPSGVFAIFSDITGLKNARDSLQKLNEELEEKVRARTRDFEQTAHQIQEQKTLLQAIFDHIPVMVALMDPSGRVGLVNREFEKITGWSLEESRSMDILSATLPDPADKQKVMDVIARSEPGWRDFKLTTRSGAVLSTSWANVRLADGSAIGIGIDVTERKKMESDLMHLATAVQQSGEGIILADSDGVIEYVNPAFENISGFSRDELVGKDERYLQSYFAGYNLKEILDQTAKGGKTWTSRQQRRRKTGETIEVDLSVSPLRDETGRITNFVSVLRDVTEETRLERQLAQSQRMEAIGSLAGGIAHDLKNILTPILINTELALEDVGEDSPVHPVLKDALEAARLGKDLVQQILTFSRRVPQKKAPVNISTVVRETIGFLRASIPSIVEVRSEIRDSCTMAFADPTQIKQVLINLGSNAGHAMREHGGVLNITESSTLLDQKTAAEISPDLKPGSYVQISVQDTGSGIDRETLEHIFEPFFTTKKGEGTGMGLAVAHGIVKEHQGAITVESSPGKGSTFTVLLPELMDDKDQGVRCREALAS